MKPTCTGDSWSGWRRPRKLLVLIDRWIVNGFIDGLIDGFMDGLMDCWMFIFRVAYLADDLLMIVAKGRTYKNWILDEI